MKKKALLLALGCAFVMAGCGSVGTTADNASAATETQAAESAEETEAQDETAAESTEEEAENTEETESTEETDSSEETESEAAEGEADTEYSLGTEITPDENGKLSNGVITITMPKELDGTYVAYSYEDEINVYEKESHDADFGGFAFGVSASDSFEDYGGMRTKIGELTDGDGKLYHICIFYPSDVQWDYTKNNEMPASYKALYDGARDIAATIEAVNGGAYVDGAGTKGEDIFGDFAKETIDKIKNAKDANELEAADLSPVYYAVTQGDEAKDPMETMGIAYYDSNLDGVDEMFIGDIESKEIYDIFSCVDGKPAHVASGHFRDYYKAHGSIIAEYVSESAGINVISSYTMTTNSTELFPQFSIKLDETDGAEYKWSVCYDLSEDKWEELTEEDYELDLSNIEYDGEKTITFNALNSFE